jgi:hypothetical protein
MDSKKQCAYWHALHFWLVITEFKLIPISITTDFKVSLINAIKEQFPTVKQIGCNFHSKQALRRKMKELKIPEIENKKAMCVGGIDRLQNTELVNIGNKLIF